MKHRYFLILSYDGTDYVGWQVQPNGVSIQGLVEKSLSLLLRYPIRVIGAGRTDAGVHALRQVAHFETEEKVNPQLIYQLNGILPPSIRIHSIEEVSATQHAQYSATRKCYHYHLWLEKPISPFVARFRHAPSFPLSLPLIKEASGYFLGSHDFASFTNKGSSVKTTTRTLHRLDLCEQEGGIRLEFEGNGFLYKMVRNIVGALIEVGKGKLDPATLPHIFAAKDRRLAPMSAPARGLFLAWVDYGTLHKSS